MATTFSFAHQTLFEPAQAEEILRAVPASPGVVALWGESGEPYLTRAADLRRRLRRLLAPPEARDEYGRAVLSKRLNLRDRVRTLGWTSTGSEFESILLLYHATSELFGQEPARKRLRLHPPAFVRLTLEHAYPRVYVTHKLSPRALEHTFGPFPSRVAAERYCDAVLDLFKLRRCSEELEVSPQHPGCAYGEMKKCMEPCKIACTDEEYAAEARSVQAFFATRGESLLHEVAVARDAASEAMDFERAAELHTRWEKVKAATTLADELVRAIPELRALVLQQAAHLSTPDEGAQEEAAVFLLERGQITAPARLSTLGVRAVREQTAVGSSLFAQPLMLAPVPLHEPESPAAALITQSPEDRLRSTLAQLESAAAEEPSLAVRCDYLALFRRWYYRPEKQRTGEVFLPGADGSWPLRRILNGAARVVLGPPKEISPVDREAAAALRKTKVLHEGREGVERVVPVLPKRRSRKSATTQELP
ncbi:MAG: excinuclease ABC subunit C [Acidobacteriaceae bacterium]|nr:excinuclease ABC subunit C [Acidobacteriaceae bacterium]